MCAMFTVMVGPLFGGVEPAVLHVYAFAMAIIVGEGWHELQNLYNVSDLITMRQSSCTRL